MSNEAALNRLAAAARSTSRRLRFDRALGRTLLLFPLVLIYALAVLTYIKVWRPGGALQFQLLIGGVVPLVIWLGGTLHAWFQRTPGYAGALRLDQHHHLHDRVASALEFSRVPESERTPFMQAAIDDAATAVQGLQPAKAAPIHLLPIEIGVVCCLIAALFFISLLEVRTYRVIKDDRPKIQALVMSPDDIDLFRKLAEQLKQQSKDPEVLAAVRKFNQLVEDMANRRLDRREVFKRMEALERELMKGTEADKEALDEGLKAMAQELKKSDLSKPIAKPLEEKKLADAEKAMRKLAERLRDKKDPISKAELEKLRKAIKKASEANASRSKALEAARKAAEDEKKSLLKKKQDGKLSKQDKSLLNKKERQLERLDREKDRAERAQRQLSRLDRELAQAAADLLKEMGASAKDLEQAAEDINRMAKEEMTDKEKEELRKRLQEMRELLRQQGKGDKKQLQRLLKFGQKARGGKPGKGGEGGEESEGGKGGKLRPGQGGSQPGDGPGGLSLGKGSGGKSIPMPGGGSGKGEGPGQGMGQGAGEGGKEPGGGKGKGGESWGTGHDPNVKGDKSEIKGSTKDVTAVASDTGQGTASSQVISGAAQRGFVGRGYKQVYTDYQTVAEDVMNRDDIPPGYRFYVRRYFQLIRPRD